MNTYNLGRNDIQLGWKIYTPDKIKLLIKSFYILSLTLTLTPLALAGSFSLLSPLMAPSPFTSPLECLALLTNPGLVWQPVSLYFVTGFTLLVETGVRLALCGVPRAAAAAFLGVPRAPASAAARRGVPKQDSYLTIPFSMSIQYS